MAEYGSVNFYMVVPSNMHSYEFTQHALHAINYCFSIFQIVDLSHRYVLSYVNILKYVPGTYYMERLIISKVTVDRSVLISALYENTFLYLEA